MKFNVIVSDPPWQFNDSLKMKDGVKRSAESQYKSIMTYEDIKNLPVNKISDDDWCLLCLWVPGALLIEGVETMKSWGFKYKQNFV